MAVSIKARYRSQSPITDICKGYIKHVYEISMINNNEMTGFQSAILINSIDYIVSQVVHEEFKKRIFTHVILHVFIKL